MKTLAYQFGHYSNFAFDRIGTPNIALGQTIVRTEKKYIKHQYVNFLFFALGSFRRPLIRIWKEHVIQVRNFNIYFSEQTFLWACHFCLVIFGRSCFSRSKYWYIKNTHQICFLCHLEETLVVLLLMIILLPRRFRVLEMMTVQAFFLLDHWPRIIFAKRTHRFYTVVQIHEKMRRQIW